MFVPLLLKAWACIIFQRAFLVTTAIYYESAESFSLNDGYLYLLMNSGPFEVYRIEWMTFFSFTMGSLASEEKIAALERLKSMCHWVLLLRKETRLFFDTVSFIIILPWKYIKEYLNT